MVTTPVPPAPPAVVAQTPTTAQPGGSGVDPLRNGQTYLNQIGWTEPPAAQTGPLVAVLDTGVDTAHPDLQASIAPGARTFAAGGGSPLTDGATHGTQVAGIIAATLNNGIGISGVSRARILPVKIAGADGQAETSALVRGIKYAIARKAKILNISFEGGVRSAVEQDAIDYAVRKGAIVVVASGNSGARRLEYPGAYRQVISVAAVDETNRPLDTSTWGPQVTLAAPGGNIVSTMPGGQYGEASGTSFAAAVVTGVAARVWAAQPRLTASQVVDILERSARDTGPRGWDEQTGLGVVSLAAALRTAPRPTDPAEPNDEPSKTFSPLGLPAGRDNVVINARVSGYRDPRDGYRVVLQAGDTLTVNLNGSPDTDMDLRLWRPKTPTLRRSKVFARTWLAASSFGPRSQEYLTFTAASGGIYVVEVDGGGGRGTYRLQLTRVRGASTTTPTGTATAPT